MQLGKLNRFILEYLLSDLAKSTSLPDTERGPNGATALVANAYMVHRDIYKNAKFMWRAFDACLRIQANDDTFAALFALLPDPGPQGGNLNKILLPLVPHLTSLAVSFNAFHKLAHGLRSILFAWAKILGPKPDNVDKSAQLFDLKGWDCKCSDCGKVKQFLKTPQTKRFSARKMTPEQMQHVYDLARKYIPVGMTTVVMKPKFVEVSIFFT